MQHKASWHSSAGRPYNTWESAFALALGDDWRSRILGESLSQLYVKFRLAVYQAFKLSFSVLRPADARFTPDAIGERNGDVISHMQTEVEGPWEVCSGWVEHRISLQGDHKNLVQWCTGAWYAKNTDFKLVANAVAGHFATGHHVMRSLPRTDFEEFITWVRRSNNVVADMGSKRARLHGPYCELERTHLEPYIVGVWDGAYGDGIAGCAAAVYTSKAAPCGQISDSMCTVLQVGIRCSARSAQQAEAIALLLLTRSITSLLNGNDLVEVFQTAPADTWMNILQ